MKHYTQLFQYGIFLGAFALFVSLWHYAVAPYILKLPSNFSYSADLVSKDNFYDPAQGKFSGEKTSQSVFFYKTLNERLGVLTIRNVFNVQTSDGKKIISTAEDYGINARTGAHSVGYGNKDREGYLFAPRFAGKSGFTHWHVNYDVPVEMVFDGAETIGGIRVYRYVGTVIADQSKNLTYLPGVPEKRKVIAHARLTLWVEPISGYLVTYDDTAEAIFVDARTGQLLEPWNKFKNTLAESSVLYHAREAEKLRAKVLFTEIGIPAIVFLVGVTLLPFLRRNKKDVFRALRDIGHNPESSLTIKFSILIFLFAASIVVVLLVWNAFDEQEQSRLNVTFSNNGVVMQNMTMLRYKSYEEVLLTASALFSTRGGLDPEEFKQYVRTLDIQKKYPGLKSMGYVKIVSEKDKKEFLSRTDLYRLKSFADAPEVPRSEYAVILSAEPGSEVNKNSIGFDMFSNSVLREALMESRAKGTLQASGIIKIFPQTPVSTEKGFFVFAPIYGSGSEDPMGYLYAAIKAGDLFSDVSVNVDFGMDYAVFDGLDMSERNKLFDSNALRDFDKLNLGKNPYRFTSLATIEMGNHEWTLYSSDKKDFGTGFLEHGVQNMSLLVGIALAFLFPLFAYYLFVLRHRSAMLIDKIQKDLSLKENEVSRVKDKFDETNKVLTKNAKVLEGKIVESNRTREAMLNVLEDVEYEKNKSDVLAKDLEKYQLAVETASEGVVITDAEGVILYVNKAELKSTGYPLEEVIGQKPSLWGKQMPKEFYEEMWRVIKVEKRTFVGEVTNIRKDRSQYLVILNISPILDDRGEVKFFVSLERDITISRYAQEQETQHTAELKKIKEKIEREMEIKTKQLSDEQARLLSSINSLSFGFIMADANGRMILSNPSVLKILEIKTVPDTMEDLARYFNPFDMLKKSEECIHTKHVVEAKEVPYRNKYLRVFFVPVSNEGMIIGHVIIMEDITESKILERSRDEFFAVASHELRTPLTAIRGNAEMILDMYADKIPDKNIREMLADINEGSIRLINIVNDFLEVSRLEQGNIVLDNTSFDINETIEKVIKVIRPAADAKQLTVEFKNPDGKPLLVFADEDKVKQVLFNLVGNAVKFTKEGRITVVLEKEKNLVKVKIIDTGIGVSALNERLLFRKFQPAGEGVLTRDVTKSTGLGLYISKLIIEKMGGTIGLEESGLGKGSTFYFTIPAHL